MTGIYFDSCPCSFLGKMLPVPKPARTCIQAAKLPGDVDVEIEAIAAT